MTGPETLDELARLAGLHSLAAQFADGSWHVRANGGTMSRTAIYVDPSLETAQRHCMQQLIAMSPMGSIDMAPIEPKKKGRR